MVGVDDLAYVTAAGRHLDGRRPVVLGLLHAVVAEVMDHAEGVARAAVVVAGDWNRALLELVRHEVAHLPEVVGRLDLERLEVVRAFDDDFVFDDAACADELEDHRVVVADDTVGRELKRRVVDAPHGVESAVRLLEPSARPRQGAADHAEVLPRLKPRQCDPPVRHLKPPRPPRHLKVVVDVVADDFDHKLTPLSMRN